MEIKCSELIQLSPNDWEAYFYRGSANYFMKKYSNAITDLDQSIAISPTEKAYLLRGDLKSIIKDYQGAIVDYTALISMKPNELIAYIDRGNAKFILEDYEGAIQDFSQAISLEPTAWAAYLPRARAKYVLKDYRGAIQDLSEAILIIESLLQEKPVEKPKSDNPEIYKAYNIYLSFVRDTNMYLKENLALSYYIRGISKIQINEISSGCLDLSKSGENGFGLAYDAIRTFCH